MSKKQHIGIITGKNLPVEIIQDQLIMDFDISNTDSYPGTGSLISDISLNSSDITIVNGSFSSLKGGAIYMTGAVNSYIDFSSVSSSLQLPSSTTRTLCFWVQPEDLNMVILADMGGPNDRGWWFRFHNGDMVFGGSQNGSTLNYRYTVASHAVIGEPCFACVTYDAATQEVLFYFNGALVSHDNGLIRSSYRNSTNKTVYSAYYNGQVANEESYFFGMQAYNKILTQSEILQNFNARKGRFNI